MPMPLEIVGLGKPEVRFVWEEGEEDTWSARELRIRCDGSAASEGFESLCATLH